MFTALELPAITPRGVVALRSGERTVVGIVPAGGTSRSVWALLSRVA